MLLHCNLLIRIYLQSFSVPLPFTPLPLPVNLRAVLKYLEWKKFPLLLKEGWPQRNVFKVLKRIVAAGVVDFNIFHNAALVEVGLSL